MEAQTQTSHILKDLSEDNYSFSFVKFRERGYVPAFVKESHFTKHNKLIDYLPSLVDENTNDSDQICFLEIKKGDVKNALETIDKEKFQKPKINDIIRGLAKNAEEQSSGRKKNEHKADISHTVFKLSLTTAFVSGGLILARHFLPSAE